MTTATATRAVKSVPRLDGMRVLLAESDPDLAAVTALLLEWLGAEVIDVDRLDAYAPRPGDVLVSDEDQLAKPLLRELRRALPSLLLAGAPERGRGLGLRTLEKPVRPSALAQALRRLAPPREGHCARHSAPARRSSAAPACAGCARGVTRRS